jgi:hypothetical protein
MELISVESRQYSFSITEITKFDFFCRSCKFRPDYGTFLSIFYDRKILVLCRVNFLTMFCRVNSVAMFLGTGTGTG